MILKIPMQTINPTCTTKSVKSWLLGYYFFKLVNGGLHTFLCP